MKTIIPILLALLALMVSIAAYLKIQQTTVVPTVTTLEAQEEKLMDGDSRGSTTSAAPQGGFEIANYMHKFQLYANKLYFAGTAQNWELAQFYVHEIEENMEVVEAANVQEDGIALTPLMRNMGLKSIEPLEKAIAANNAKAFDEAYTLLIANCNNCHNAAAHAFIKIQKPTKPVFDNQVYGK
jgi:hypothetical protein